MQRYPGLEQRTRWVPSRYVPPTSKVVWRFGRFGLHKSGATLLALNAMAVVAMFVTMIMYGPLDPFAVSFVIATLVWPSTISPAHHELAHALMARHVGIAVDNAGFHARGAYVSFRVDVDGVTLRGWIQTLAAGIVSNLVIATTLIVGWSLVGDGWFTPVGLFCLLVSTIEFGTAALNAIPQSGSDGGAVMDALRIARSPVVL